VTVLYGYNEKGEQELQAVDVNRNGQIDLGGPDRVTRSRSFVEASGRGGVPVRVSVQESWLTLGSDAPVVLSRTETSLDGRRTWSIDAAGAVTYSERSLAVNSGWQQRTVLPDGSERVQQFAEGRGPVGGRKITTADRILHGVCLPKVSGQRSMILVWRESQQKRESRFGTTRCAQGHGEHEGSFSGWWLVWNL
jgi:hypothetical protein